jgi:hypothetical protein
MLYFLENSLYIIQLIWIIGHEALISVPVSLKTYIPTQFCTFHLNFVALFSHFIFSKRQSHKRLKNSFFTSGNACVIISLHCRIFSLPSSLYWVSILLFCLLYLPNWSTCFVSYILLAALNLFILRNKYLQY